MSQTQKSEAQLLSALLKGCRFPDEQILRGGGLDKISKAYDAFPQTQDGIKLCLLLPKGLPPADALRLDVGQLAARRVIVLREQGSTWSKMWPTVAPAVSSAPVPLVSGTPAKGDVSIELLEEED